MNDGLTFGERLLLYMLIDGGPRDDYDRTEDRVLINRGLAERFTGEGGVTMIRVTAAGQQLHDVAFPPSQHQALVGPSSGRGSCDVSGKPTD